VDVNVSGKLDVHSENPQTSSNTESNKWADPITWFTLYVWGIVNYTDIFGDNWETKFAQLLYWQFDNRLLGKYLPEHSKAT
jgi:hypothetical protein